MVSSRRRRVRAARRGLVGQADQRGPADEVVRERGDHRPGGVGGVVAGWEVREGLVFEVADGLLDDGVVAVFGLDDRERVGAVGHEREVPPVGPQLGLRADQAGAPDDHPPAAEHRFGDLRFSGVGVVGERGPGVLGDLRDLGLDVLVVAHPDRVGPAGPLRVGS